jgi:hypothetical protein
MMLKSLLLTHYRLGFTRLLIYIDLTVLFLILVDFATYWYMGFSLSSAVTLQALPQPYDLGLPLLAFAFFLLLVLPSIIGLAKVAAIPGFVGVNPALRPRLVVAFHLCCCLFFVAASYLLVRMEMLSGWQQKGDVFTTQFHSAFRTLVTSSIFVKAVTALSSLGGLAVSALGGYFLIGKEVAKPMRQYMTRASLADLPRDLRPNPRATHGAINHVETNRGIPAIRVANQKLVQACYSPVLTRSDRASFANDLLVECDTLIRDYLLEETTGKGHGTSGRIESLEIYEDEDSAWEVAIRTAPKTEMVVLGPYLSLAIVDIVKACCADQPECFKRVSLKESSHYLNWQKQEAEIIREIESFKITTSSVTLIISHVSYATGLTIPMKQLVARIRGALYPRSVYVIVDGTNAVGNKHRIPVDGDWDTYVFYPHRWLMASERCAVVLTRKAEMIGAVPHGSLRNHRARYNDVFRTIASLRAGLELVKVRDMEYFWDRCTKLREAFVAGLPRSFQILGSQSNMASTFIISCYPTDGNSWRPSVRDMDDEVGKICTSASMISVDESRPWMRLSFPYYLDPRELNRLNTFLDDNVAN